MQHFALKRLSNSDLTVLSTHHGVVTKTNQKGINLDQSPFSRRLYPLLGELLKDHKAKVAASKTSGGLMEKPKGPRFEVELYAGGPDGHAPIVSQHHIGLYDKNWRLNGAFIRPPANEPNLYKDLEEDDFALLSFSGEPVPSTVGLLWVRQNGTASDASLYQALMPLIGTASMKALTVEQIRAVTTPLGLVASHALFTMLPDAAFEAEVAKAVEAGSAAIKKVVTSTPRIITAETLAKIQRAREENGRAGEEMVNAYLSANPDLTVDWVASRNTLAPLDFRTTHTGSGRVTSLDVKTTASPHKAAFHLSQGEVEEAAGSPNPYLIFRISGLDGEGGILRVSEDIRGFAKNLLAALKSLPAGATAESFVVEPDAWGMGWGEPVKLKRPAP